MKSRLWQLTFAALPLLIGFPLVMLWGYQHDPTVFPIRSLAVAALFIAALAAYAIWETVDDVREGKPILKRENLIAAAPIAVFAAAQTWLLYAPWPGYTHERFVTLNVVMFPAVIVLSTLIGIRKYPDWAKMGIMLLVVIVLGLFFMNEARSAPLEPGDAPLVVNVGHGVEYTYDSAGRIARIKANAHTIELHYANPWIELADLMRIDGGAWTPQQALAAKVMATARPQAKCGGDVNQYGATPPGEGIPPPPVFNSSPAVTGPGPGTAVTPTITPPTQSNSPVVSKPHLKTDCFDEQEAWAEEGYISNVEEGESQQDVDSMASFATQEQRDYCAWVCDTIAQWGAVACTIAPAIMRAPQVFVPCMIVNVGVWQVCRWGCATKP